MGSKLLAIAVCAIAMMSVFAAACGGDDGDSDEPEAAATTAGDQATEAPDDAGEDDGGEDASGGGSGEGSATLTIGDQSWTFDNYYCFSGAEDTGNDRVAFSSGSMGAPDGVRLQLDVSIQDRMEEDRLEGDGVIHSLSLNDIEDFENPSVGWSSISGLVGESTAFIEVGEGTVSAETTFDDELTDAVIEEVPGTLEATCGE